MTTIVLMSDVHGNLPALEAVEASLPPHDHVYVAGDLCLEGPQPAEVIDFIAQRGWLAVMGNTDCDILDGPQDDSTKDQRIAWTRDQLGEERLRWLGELPFERRLSVDTLDLLVV